MFDKFLMLCIAAMIGFLVVSMIALGIKEQTVYNKRLDEQSTKLTIGPKEYPECQATVTVQTWDEMNEMKIWAWVAACVEAKEKN